MKSSLAHSYNIFSYVAIKHFVNVSLSLFLLLSGRTAHDLSPKWPSATHRDIQEEWRPSDG